MRPVIIEDESSSKRVVNVLMMCGIIMLRSADLQANGQIKHVFSPTDPLTNTGKVMRIKAVTSETDEHRKQDGGHL